MPVFTKKPCFRFYSLRLRFVLAIISICAFFWLVSLAIMVRVAWNETNTVFDDALKKSGALLLLSTDNIVAPTHMRKRNRAHHLPDEDDLYFQIIQLGRVISGSKDSPSRPFVENFPKRKGFSDIIINDEAWRIYVIRGRDRITEVQVGQSLKMRTKILKGLTNGLIIPALWILVVLAFSSSVAIYYLLRPLNRMAVALTKKSPQDLSQLPLESKSIELNAINNALNGVLSRLETALVNERHFTADAAHELRTPLAALSMQAQLLQRQHPDIAVPLQTLREDIYRCTHLINHLLLLARLDPLKAHDQEALACEWIDLDVLFGELAQTLEKPLQEKHAVLTRSVHVQRLHANSEMIHILLRNLLDNAIRYSGINSHIALIATQDDRGIILTVRDNGPGVSQEQLTRLTQRFFRVLGTEEQGSGLGLSIVQRIAELHRAILGIYMGEDGTGLVVTVTFPPLFWNKWFT